MRRTKSTEQLHGVRETRWRHNVYVRRKEKTGEPKFHDWNEDN